MHFLFLFPLLGFFKTVVSKCCQNSWSQVCCGDSVAAQTKMSREHCTEMQFIFILYRTGPINMIIMVYLATLPCLWAEIPPAGYIVCFDLFCFKCIFTFLLWQRNPTIHVALDGGYDTMNYCFILRCYYFCKICMCE